MRYLSVFALAAMCAAVALSTPILPDAVGEAAVGVPPTGVYASGNPAVQPVVAVYDNGLTTALGVANAFGVSNSPATPTVSASGSGGAGAEVFMDYYYFVGGVTGVPVPLIISGTTGVYLSPDSLAGNGQAYAKVIISVYDGPPLLGLFNCAGYDCGGVSWYTTISSGAFTVLQTVTPDTIIQIDLGAVASPNGGDPLTHSANAIADPYIQIDPTFLAQNPGAFLEFSPGIVNAPLTSTPEPSGAALLGFGLIGLTAARKLRARLT